VKSPEQQYAEEQLAMTKKPSSEDDAKLGESNGGITALFGKKKIAPEQKKENSAELVFAAEAAEAVRQRSTAALQVEDSGVDKDVASLFGKKTVHEKAEVSGSSNALQHELMQDMAMAKESKQAKGTNSNGAKPMSSIADVRDIFGDSSKRSHNNSPIKKRFAGEFAAAVAAQQRVLDSVKAHTAAAATADTQEDLGEATFDDGLTKKERMQRLFGIRPNDPVGHTIKRAAAQPLRHTKAVSEFDKAVKDEDEKLVVTLGGDEDDEGEDNEDETTLIQESKGATSTSNNIKHDLKLRDEMQQKFDSFLAKRKEELVQVGAEEEKDELFSSMKAKFGKFMAGLGEAKKASAKTTPKPKPPAAKKANVRSSYAYYKETMGDAGHKVPHGTDVQMVLPPIEESLAKPKPAAERKQAAGLDAPMVLDPINKGQTLEQSETDTSLGDLAFDFNQEDVGDADAELTGMDKSEKEALMVNKLSKLFDGA